MFLIWGKGEGHSG